MVLFCSSIMVLCGCSVIVVRFRCGCVFVFRLLVCSVWLSMYSGL